MFYTTARAEWRPGNPLPPSLAPAGLHRTRDAAQSLALGHPTLAVTVRYDATRGVVTAQGPSARASSKGWEAPAIFGPRGGLTVLAAIPAELVHVVGPPEIRVHSGSTPDQARPHIRVGEQAVAGRYDPPTRVA